VNNTHFDYQKNVWLALARSQKAYLHSLQLIIEKSKMRCVLYMNNYGTYKVIIKCNVDIWYSPKSNVCMYGTNACI